MAEPIKRGKKYRHSIMVGGNRKTGTFDTKAEARAWEANLRAAYKMDKNTPLLRPRYKLSEACDRYLNTVSVHKREALDWEARRFNLFIERFNGEFLDSIDSRRLGEWRDDLLKTVSGSTVNRYFNLFSNLFTIAEKEWKWVDSNPFSGVRRPKENPPREAVWRWQQIKAVLREGQRRGGKYHQVTQAFHIALRTGMRLQEAMSAPENHYPKSKVVSIKRRKEDVRPINIPLTPQANRVIKSTPKFSVSANEASTLFSRLTKQIGIQGLEFKDSRATALTLMSKKMDVQTLQRISRHKDINILLSVYYRETAEEISARL